jgi:hypothetical protein
MGQVSEFDHGVVLEGLAKKNGMIVVIRPSSQGGVSESRPWSRRRRTLHDRRECKNVVLE